MGNERARSCPCKLAYSWEGIPKSPFMPTVVVILGSHLPYGPHDSDRSPGCGAFDFQGNKPGRKPHELDENPAGLHHAGDNGEHTPPLPTGMSRERPSQNAREGLRKRTRTGRGGKDTQDNQERMSACFNPSIPDSEEHPFAPSGSPSHAIVSVGSDLTTTWHKLRQPWARRNMNPEDGKTIGLLLIALISGGFVYFSWHEPWREFQRRRPIRAVFWMVALAVMAPLALYTFLLFFARAIRLIQQGP